MEKNKVIGYIRVSTDQQDVKSQKLALLEYANKNLINIDEFIEAQVSSRKSTKERRIDELMGKLIPADTLMVTELSRLGRNMMNTLLLINKLSENNVKLIFVQQPELSTTGKQSKLLLAIYSYFAESERDYISMRTKQGLEAAKAYGKKIGRPKGSRNKKPHILDTYKLVIKEYLEMDLSLMAICKLLNKQLEKPVGYTTLRYYVQNSLAT